MSDAKFLASYKKLNPAQKEAVDTIDGPVMVIAGPGTGKTTVLTLRIAHILRKTDTSPDAILALTFTESGVRAMREKLIELIGPSAYRVHIHTFHSFANDLIKTYPDRFPRIIGSEHIEDLEQMSLVEEMLAHGDFELLRPKGDPGYYVRKIIDAVRNLKKDNISADDLDKLVEKEEKAVNSAPDLKHRSGKYEGEIKGEYRERLERIEKNKELVQAYRSYEQRLEESRLYDFEDMIIEVVRRLEKDKDFRLRLQEEYQYLLADEHQDANRAQNQLLELLASFHEKPNLFIVGDEKQAIFRFQGASLENFLYFRKKFPGTKLVVLSENYRSHQTILDAAHTLISNNPVADDELRTPLTASAEHFQEKVIIVCAPERSSEIAYVADVIERLLKKGVPASEIAVLTRDNAHALPCEREMKKRMIPVSRFADADILDHPYIDGLLTLIRASADPASDELVGKAIFAGFLRLDLLALSRAVSERKRGEKMIDVLKAHTETKKVAELLARFARVARREPLVEAFETVVHESGFIEFLIAHPRSHELLPMYAALLDAVTRYAERDKKATLADFVGRLEKAKSHGHSITASHIPPDGVQLLTAHGAKGLEFDYVFILHANDGVWGGRKNRRPFVLPIGIVSEDAVEDERRLFYVALTRARKGIFVSYCQRGDDGKERSPSRFIFEIADEHKEEKTIPYDTSSYQRPPPKSPHEAPILEAKYLRQLFLERGFSVTHLNNFLECPWRYFFVDLIRIPRRQDNAALYGSAVHDALKHYFDAYAREEDIKPERAAELFENYLYRTHMPDYDFKRFVKEGKREVKEYLSYWKFSRTIFNEFKIVGVPFQVGKDEVVLTGKLDKVEIVRDGVVNVVDYKTGKPRTRNEILGKTKSSSGDYFRQLVFYRLLLGRYKKGEWNMETGTIDFIKPDARGTFHREEFVISDGEVKELEGVISNTVQDIVSLAFWNKTCGEKDCEWCRLRSLITTSEERR